MIFDNFIKGLKKSFDGKEHLREINTCRRCNKPCFFDSCLKCEVDDVYKEHNKKIYMFIRGNGGIENFDFEILETITACNKELLHKKENEFIEKYEYNLNEINAPTYKTKKEYDKIKTL